jgi:hypothetical protein
MEVTIADITAALKCSHEPLDLDIPWIDYPSMLTLEDIVSDMCEGQYADSHSNAASKAKILPKLWFVDVMLYKNVCSLGHKTQRQDIFLSALYSFHQGFWCSILEIIWRQIYKFWEGVHHRVTEGTGQYDHSQVGVCLSLFSSVTYLERRGLKAMRWTCQSLRAHGSAESSGTRVVPTCLEPRQHHSQSPWTFMRWQLSRREQLSQRGRQNMMSSQKKKKNMKR